MLKLLLGNPYVLIGLAVLIGGLAAFGVWERHEATVARESQAVAERQAAISAADAERWQKASGERDAAIGQLKTALDQQSDEVAQARAKETELRASLDTARAANETLQRTADQLSKELDDEATKAPADVRDLGPIVLRRAPGLFDN